VALLSQREIKISVAVILLLALTAVIVTLIVFRRGDDEGGTREPARAPQAAERQDEAYDSFRLLIPEDYKGVFRPDWIPYRERHSSWASSQIDPYWIEPRTLVEEELEKSTDESVRAFLEELP